MYHSGKNTDDDPKISPRGRAWGFEQAEELCMAAKENLLQRVEYELVGWI